MATKRPRGFDFNWKPRPETKALIGVAAEILSDNAEILPLTLRQIFYMLVSNYGYDKTEKSYKRFCETMNRARRGGMIPMDHIRDDGLSRRDPHQWRGEADYISAVKSGGEAFRLYRQEGQDRFLIVWCEAGGMLPQLARAVEEFGVPAISSGGFDSVTTKHDFAREVCNLGEVEILHIGDHDPSGVHMFSSLDEDLAAFVEHYGGLIELTRLAVTPSQIRRMDLPTSPPKATDNRSFHGQTTQAEAIPPKVLRDIVRRAITDRQDPDILQRVKDQEIEIRASLHAKFQHL